MLPRCLARPKGHARMKRVLAIQNYWDDTPGNLGEIFKENDIACDFITADEAGLPDPADCDAIFALGGPQHANDPLPYLEQQKVLLRQVVTQDIPYLGLCLGGQSL